MQRSGQKKPESRSSARRLIRFTLLALALAGFTVFPGLAPLHADDSTEVKEAAPEIEVASVDRSEKPGSETVSAGRLVPPLILHSVSTPGVTPTRPNTVARHAWIAVNALPLPADTGY